jgi:hypothetical protein
LSRSTEVGGPSLTGGEPTFAEANARGKVAPKVVIRMTTIAKPAGQPYRDRSNAEDFWNGLV